MRPKCLPYPGQHRAQLLIPGYDEEKGSRYWIVQHQHTVGMDVQSQQQPKSSRTDGVRGGRETPGFPQRVRLVVQLLLAVNDIEIPQRRFPYGVVRCIDDTLVSHPCLFPYHILTVDVRCTDLRST